MEQKLRRLFDYQKFQRNPRLTAMIADVEERYDGAIADDALEWVNAAGEPEAMDAGARKQWEEIP